jgi:hypothetical protein
MLKVARTIADLEGADAVERRHLAEALQYRAFETFDEPGQSPQRSPSEPLPASFERAGVPA